MDKRKLRSKVVRMLKKVGFKYMMGTYYFKMYHQLNSRFYNLYITFTIKELLKYGSLKNIKRYYTEKREHKIRELNDYFYSTSGNVTQRSTSLKR